ncbi:putative HicB family RNase H-like nuclease [Rhizobium sp. SG_E_25_P2]|uniref:type II toxin-antitoxin system HicB family antitoxin n=1 Tax=Rhizobium sp. SG_E_25_P2 TaxID=2879942 RepID=UPI002476A1E9|nr:toxin-antitoxin system HicB family antitoxin [Rhizobium sp. SG_E_25_P2]MDH6268474.1 putative HicB family RNase H-like nuclease [Rhizobium sp. SG_E_25_P2]
MNTLSYKEYQASVEFDDGTLFVKVLHLDDLLIGECDAARDASKVLEDLVEAYLADCAEAGREPSKPFKGSFNVRIPPELH